MSWITFWLQLNLRLREAEFWTSQSLRGCKPMNRICGNKLRHQNQLCLLRTFVNFLSYDSRFFTQNHLQTYFYTSFLIPPLSPLSSHNSHLQLLELLQLNLMVNLQLLDVFLLEFLKCAIKLGMPRIKYGCLEKQSRGRNDEVEVWKPRAYF